MVKIIYSSLYILRQKQWWSISLLERCHDTLYSIGRKKHRSLSRLKTFQRIEFSKVNINYTLDYSNLSLDRKLPITCFLHVDVFSNHKMCCWLLCFSNKTSLIIWSLNFKQRNVYIFRAPYSVFQNYSIWNVNYWNYSEWRYTISIYKWIESWVLQLPKYFS